MFEVRTCICFHFHLFADGYQFQGQNLSNTTIVKKNVIGFKEYFFIAESSSTLFMTAVCIKVEKLGCSDENIFVFIVIRLSNGKHFSFQMWQVLF
jgi:hypothetical protein